MVVTALIVDVLQCVSHTTTSNVVNARTSLSSIFLKMRTDKILRLKVMCCTVCVVFYGWELLESIRGFSVSRTVAVGVADK